MSDSPSCKRKAPAEACAEETNVKRIQPSSSLHQSTPQSLKPFASVSSAERKEKISRLIEEEASRQQNTRKLVDSVRRRDSVSVLKCLEAPEGVDYEWKDNLGGSVIHTAVANSLEVSTFSKLMRVINKKYIDAPDALGRTPLMYSASISRVETSLYLIEQGARVDCVTRYGSVLHALSKAINYSKKLTAKILNNPQVLLILNAKDELGRTALELATKSRNWNLVINLSKKGALWPDQTIEEDASLVKDLLLFAGKSNSKAEILRTCLNCMPTERVQSVLQYKPEFLETTAFECHVIVLDSLLKFAAATWHAHSHNMMRTACAVEKPLLWVRCLLQAGADSHNFEFPPDIRPIVDEFLKGQRAALDASTTGLLPPLNDIVMEYLSLPPKKQKG